MLSNSLAAQLIVLIAMKSVAYFMTATDLCITKCLKTHKKGLMQQLFPSVEAVEA